MRIDISPFNVNSLSLLSVNPEYLVFFDKS